MRRRRTLACTMLACRRTKTCSRAIPRLPQSLLMGERRETRQATTSLPRHNRAEQVRIAAQMAFVEMDDVSAVKRALRSKHRSADRLQPEDIIYFWRERREAGQGAFRSADGAVRVSSWR